MDHKVKNNLTCKT